MTGDNLARPSADPSELAYFEGLAHRWWDEEGPFWPLHRMNAFRLGYLRQHLCAGLAGDPAAERPLAGLSLLDIGCGGGILSEALSRLGAQVTAIDVVAKNIRVAALHAERSGLAIDYRLCGAEDLAAAGATFDAVLNMEVVEHVEDLPAFLAACALLVRPGGRMVVATINRTVLSYLIAILGAEYVLRWLPKGTHHWRKLVRPNEVTSALGPGYRLIHRTGVRVHPWDRSFHYTKLMAVNYMMVLEREGSA